MKRNFGKMPLNEIENTFHFKEKNGANVTITVGKNGWTVIFCDNTKIYKDNVADALTNFELAVKEAEFKVGKLTLIYNTNEQEG